MTKPTFTWVMPNLGWFGKRHWHNALPYTEGLITAVLNQKGYEVKAIDANINNFTEFQLEEKIRKEKPEVVGISSMSIEYRLCAHKSFEIIKKASPKTKTILGGVYPTLSPEIATKDKNIDFIVYSDGENRLPELLNAIGSRKGFEEIDGLSYRKDGELVTSPVTKPGVLDLDSLPIPDYSIFNTEKYMTECSQKKSHNFYFKRLPAGITMTSRGCAYSCGYCASQVLYGLSGKKVRTRSPEKVLEEIDMLVNKYGMKELILVDDSLLIPKQRAIKMFDLISKKHPDLIWTSNNLDLRHCSSEVLDKMKESGCYQLTVSIESGCSNTFKRMNRKSDLGDVIERLTEARKKGFDEIISNFVVGYPGDTWEDITETFNFADRLRKDKLLDYALFSIATPLPQTDLHKLCKENRYLPEDFNFESPKFYGFAGGFIETPEFGAKELQILRAYAWDLINFETKEDREKIASMTGVTLDELKDWRKGTRSRFGYRIAKPSMKN